MSGRDEDYSDLGYEDDEFPQVEPSRVRRLLFAAMAPLAFARDWVTTRSVGAFFQALPFVVLGGGALGVAAQSRTTDLRHWTKRYEAEADAAMARGDLNAADIYYRKLATLDPADSSAVYGEALVAER